MFIFITNCGNCNKIIYKCLLKYFLQIRKKNIWNSVYMIWSCRWPWTWVVSSTPPHNSLDGKTFKEESTRYVYLLAIVCTFWEVGYKIKKQSKNYYVHLFVCYVEPRQNHCWLKYFYCYRKLLIRWLSDSLKWFRFYVNIAPF